MTGRAVSIKRSTHRAANDAIGLRARQGRLALPGGTGRDLPDGEQLLEHGARVDGVEARGIGDVRSLELGDHAVRQLGSAHPDLAVVRLGVVAEQADELHLRHRDFGLPVPLLLLRLVQLLRQDADGGGAGALVVASHGELERLPDAGRVDLLAEVLAQGLVAARLRRGSGSS
jgi:hypothetical protein